MTAAPPPRLALWLAVCGIIGLAVGLWRPGPPADVPGLAAARDSLAAARGALAVRTEELAEARRLADRAELAAARASRAADAARRRADSLAARVPVVTVTGDTSVSVDGVGYTAPAPVVRALAALAASDSARGVALVAMSLARDSARVEAAARTREAAGAAVALAASERARLAAEAVAGTLSRNPGDRCTLALGIPCPSRPVAFLLGVALTLAAVVTVAAR